MWFTNSVLAMSGEWRENNNIRENVTVGYKIVMSLRLESLYNKLL